jgi:hypothetical protein
MTRYTIELNKKGMILSFKVINADPDRFPVKNLTGRHFSYLVGDDCRRDLRSIFQQISKTRQPAVFRTLFAPKGPHSGPVVEWTVQAKSVSIFWMSRYLLTGRDPE